MTSFEHAEAYTIQRDSERGWNSDKVWISARPVDVWTKNKADALALSREDAERLANDWQSWSDTKGACYTYSAAPLEGNA